MQFRRFDQNVVLWPICLCAAALICVRGWAQDAPLVPPVPGVDETGLVDVVFEPPPAAQDDLHAEIKQLLGRIDQLEKAESKRSKSEAEKKAADAKKPTVKFSQEIQLDAYTFNQDQASKDAYGNIQNGVDFRRARVALQGDYGPSEYRIEMDFAQAGRPTFLDVYGGFHDLPVVGRMRAGYFFEPFSLERVTSNRFQQFLERSMVDQAFAPVRNPGVGVNNTFANERGTWAVSGTKARTDVFGDAIQDNFSDAITGRVTWLPWYDEPSGGRYFLHLGTAYSFRGANNEQVRFAAQPDAREGAATTNVPFFVDTGNIPAYYFQLMGLEAAWVNGPFSIQSEYVMSPVDSKYSGTLFFHGWYAYASYFLTGEHRPYRRDLGIFDRLIPKRDFLRYQGRPEDKCLDLGPGAWELAMRVDFLDLNDAAVHGGQITNLTVAVNWYLTPYVRIMTNYVHSFAESPGGIRSDTDIFGTRFQYDF